MTDKRSRGKNSGLSDIISVLHVDDEEISLKAIKIYLEESTEGKIKVDSLINPEQVLRRLHEKAYDVIVVDYQMPSMDGLQLLELLRNQNNNIPFIILTGRGREDIAIRALNLGANRYIKKRMDTESQFNELFQAIKDIVRHSRVQHALQESEERYRNLFENFHRILNSMADGVYIVNAQHEIEFVNSALKQEFGSPNGKKCYGYFS